jgi:undecaprenyl-diphosphatase
LQIFAALVLGVVQGFTEFLPVSSTAHLVLVPWALKWDSPLLNSLDFDVALHLGTLVAVLGYFIKDWILLARSFFSSLTKLSRRQFLTQWERLAWLVVVATIPGAVLGVMFEKYIETTFRSPLLIAGTLVIVAILMLLAERSTVGRGREMERMSLPAAVMIGFAQASALVPGVSRSGATITAGLWAGYRREAAARFSFLLSTPIIAGASLMKLGHLIKGVQAGNGPVIAAGVAASAVSGFLAIAFLINYLKRHKLDLFAYYRIALAAAILVLYHFK